MAYQPPIGSTVAYQIVPSSLLSGSSIFGQLPAGTAVVGSVATLQGTNPWIVNFANSSILAGQTGTRVSSLVSTVPSSVIVGSSIFGQLPAGTALIGSVAALQGTNPWIVTGSVQGFPTTQNVSGSVVATQGTNPWITTFSNASILATQQGTKITSVVSSIPSSMLSGIYAHRNDAVASFLGGNLSWNPVASDSAGRTLTKPFVSDNGTLIEYVGSVVSTSVTAIQASAIGMRNYVTDFWIANTGSVATRVTFQDGSASVLAHTIAPAGGGSNAIGINIPFKSARAQDLAFVVGTPVSILFMTVRGYQAP